MPPKIKITKEDIITAALDIVRSSGAQGINARNIAAALDCSTQPVFSNFATMDELRLAVAEVATELCQTFIQREVERKEFPAYKASGIAYIRFAKEERELFKFLYMCDRSGAPIPESSSINSQMESMVRDNTGLGDTDAKLFHLEMWAYVHGIASMFATGFLDLEWGLVSKMLTDAYQGLKKQHKSE